MRRVLFLIASASSLTAALACSGSNNGSAFQTDAGGASGSGSGGGSSSGGSGSSGGSSGSSSGGLGGSSSGDDGGPNGDAQVTVTNTIYVNTDDSLYSMDPQSMAVTLIGKFAGVSDSSLDSTITDVAVNAAGDVYVNSESVVYKTSLPSSGTGTVSLTKVATIAAQNGARFYALAFTPADALGAGTGEVLIGGDGSGELWSIDATNGDTKDLGNFGPDPDVGGTQFMSLSGDIVFYVDGANKPTGLATIRSCAPAAKSGNAPTCTKTNDVLAGINMTELAAAYTSGTPSKSLNGGMYGGSTTTKGPGTGQGELFGLGAWNGDVYGFSRNLAGSSSGGATPPHLVTIATPSGVGSVQPGSFSFTNGWSGAGVTTTVTVTITQPPPPPPPK